MATLYSPAVLAGIMPDHGVPAGVVLERHTTWTASEATGATDTIQMIPIPKGAQIIDVKTKVLVATSLASKGAVGDGDSTGRFYSAVALDSQTVKGYDDFAAAISNLGYEYTADDTIDILLSSQICDSGTSIYMSVLYKMEGGIADET